LEGHRLLLEPERPLHGLYKKFAALLNPFVLTEYFSSIFVPNIPYLGQDRYWLRILLKSGSVNSLDPDPDSVIWIKNIVNDTNKKVKIRKVA
jgi:hypothetical protein